MQGVFLPELGSEVVAGLLATMALFLPPSFGDVVFIGDKDFSAALRPTVNPLLPILTFLALLSFERLFDALRFIS